MNKFLYLIKTCMTFDIAIFKIYQHLSITQWTRYYYYLFICKIIKPYIYFREIEFTFSSIKSTINNCSLTSKQLPLTSN